MYARARCSRSPRRAWPRTSSSGNPRDDRALVGVALFGVGRSEPTGAPAAQFTISAARAIAGVVRSHVDHGEPRYTGAQHRDDPYPPVEKQQADSKSPGHPRVVARKGEIAGLGDEHLCRGVGDEGAQLSHREGDQLVEGQREEADNPASAAMLTGRSDSALRSEIAADVDRGEDRQPRPQCPGVHEAVRPCTATGDLIRIEVPPRGEARRTRHACR